MSHIICPYHSQCITPLQSTCRVYFIATSTARPHSRAPFLSFSLPSAFRTPSDRASPPPTIIKMCVRSFFLTLSRSLAHASCTHSCSFAPPPVPLPTPPLLWEFSRPLCLSLVPSSHSSCLLVHTLFSFLSSHHSLALFHPCLAPKSITQFSLHPLSCPLEPDFSTYSEQLLAPHFSFWNS